MNLIRFFVTALLTLTLAQSAYASVDCKATHGKGNNIFTLATGSPGELGLLEQLGNHFNTANGTSMCWKKAGSGKSL